MIRQLKVPRGEALHLLPVLNMRPSFLCYIWIFFFLSSPRGRDPVGFSVLPGRPGQPSLEVQKPVWITALKDGPTFDPLGFYCIEIVVYNNINSIRNNVL